MFLKDIDDQNSIVYKVADDSGEYKKYKDFTTLESWKLAGEVKLFFYHEVLPCLPVEEKFNLDSQIRSASISSTANIL